MVGLILLFLTAQAAPLRMCGIGLQTTEAVHMAADHHGRLYHEFKADGALQFGLVYKSADLSFFDDLLKF